MERLIQDRWLGDSTPTVGAAFSQKSVPVDGKNIVIGLWDTAGAGNYIYLYNI